MIQHTTVHLDGVCLGGNGAVVDELDKGGAKAYLLYPIELQDRSNDEGGKDGGEGAALTHAHISLHRI